MSDDLLRNQINFTLSESARNHLLKYLPGMAEAVSKRGLDLALNWSGGGREEVGGRVTWQYRGPNFIFGGRKPEDRLDGKPYDLLGFTVWMRELDTILLEGRVLTLEKVGSPEPREQLVIENAPPDYFKQFTQGNKSGGCCRRSQS